MAALEAADASTITASIAELTLEDINTRHRKERKELQAKIQALKKNAPKSDKRKRKEAMEEIAGMEKALELRQADELNNINNVKSQNQMDSSTLAETNQKVTAPTRDEETEAKEVNLPPETHNQQQRLSKAQKRREKKSREAKQREADILAASQEDSSTEPKTIETAAIVKLLKERQLMIHHILSDGDCLYNAIRHQLLETGLGNYTVSQLRNETANYIAANKDALIFYMTNTQTGNPLTDAEFIEYCESVRNTPAWGGQIELKALSSILKVPIEVLQATGAPTLQGADEFAGPNLIITYHRHMYSLGEHYNSTKSLDATQEIEESDAE